MTRSQQQIPLDQPTFWRKEGGEAWTANIETVERQIADLSEILLDRAAPKSDEIVLDVGCGGGVTSKAVAERVGPAGQVIGVDVSDVILDVARQRYSDVPNLRFETADAQTTSLPSSTFDLILSRFGVMFFEDPIAAFGNLRLSLKDNGRLAFICWRAPAENPWMAIPAAAVFEILGPPPPPDPNAPGPFAFADPDRVRQVLEQSGFANIDFERIDEYVNLGTIDQAVSLMSRLGPAAAALGDASETDRAKAVEAVSQALREHVTAEGLKLPSGTWIVSATG